MKKVFKKYPIDSAEYVVLHARWKKSRGCNPSLPFIHLKNPRKALYLANKLAYFPINEFYLKSASLAKYFCQDCGANNVKLWRGYSSSLVNLLCAPCAAKNQNEKIEDIDALGKRTNGMGDKSDQIGWYVPAVPTEDEKTYWGYSAVPGPAISWWQNLPTLKVVE